MKAVRAKPIITILQSPFGFLLVFIITNHYYLSAGIKHFHMTKPNMSFISSRLNTGRVISIWAYNTAGNVPCGPKHRSTCEISGQSCARN